MPSVLFPRFELPEKLENAPAGPETRSGEIEVKILGGMAAKLPLQMSFERAGTTLKVTRQLTPGKKIELDFEGSPSILEAWSETHVIDLERKIVQELRRELRFLTQRGPQKFRTIARHELKAREVRLLSPAERERAERVDRELS